MAYRNFREEPLYSPPESYSFPFLQHALASEAQKQASQLKAIQDEKKRRLELADQYKANDIKAGKYTETQSMITEGAKQIVSKAQQDILENGMVSPDTRKMQEALKGVSEQSNINWNRARELENNIGKIGTKKPWYRSDIAMERIKKAEYGEDIKDEQKRAASLDAVNVDLTQDPENLLNNPLAISSWMDTKKEIARQSSIEKGDQTVKSSIKSIFAYDDKKKQLNITADDVNQYFAFEPSAETLYTNRALALKRSQAERYVAEQKASGEKLDVEKVYNQFIQNPKSNPYDQSSVGAWKYKLASDDIRKQAGLETNFEVSQDEQSETEKNESKNDALIQPTLISSRTGTKGQNKEQINEHVGYGIRGMKGATVVPYQDITVAPKGVFFPDGKPANANNSNSFNVRATQLSYGLVTKTGNPILGTHAQKLSSINNITSKDNLRNIIPNLIVEGTIIDKASIENDAPDSEIGTDSQSGSLFGGKTAPSKTKQQNNRVMFAPDYQTLESLNLGSKGKVDYTTLPKPQEAAEIEKAIADKAKELYGKEMQFERMNKQDFELQIKDVQTQYPKSTREETIKAIIKAKEKAGVILQVTDF
jgi:hypothetical protein